MSKARKIFFRISFWLALGFLLGIPLRPEADAGAYRYTDKHGTLNFTDRFESVPKEYRDQVRPEMKEQRMEPPTASIEENKGEAAVNRPRVNEEPPKDAGEKDKPLE
ncbi:MAG: hypothetical protein NTY64_20680 [Deltaproteobacteria bacterium]|nr:hypothetical protein [Deltaproteobacteria bacterium]